MWVKDSDDEIFFSQLFVEACTLCERDCSNERKICIAISTTSLN